MSINVCNDRSMASITSLPSGVSGGSLVLLETQTASSSSTISFTSNIDSTYKEYQFHFIDIHPATDAAHFQVQGSTNSGSSYGITATSSFFAAVHQEDGGSASLAYYTSLDIAQGTGFIDIGAGDTGNGNDESLSGKMHLFDPSNTTFVKHFMARSSCYNPNDTEVDAFANGYFNTTSAIDAIQFKMSSGNIDAGTIKMYGVV